MARKALLFGLNYLNDSAALQGCINDARNIQQLLLDHMGYRAEDILLCTDETALKPTKSVMLRLLREVCLWTHRQPVKQIFVSYSGHGTSLEDDNGDETDGKEEALMPLDFRTNGLIRDDELGMLLRQVHPRTDVILLVDACHSGSILDLPFRYVGNNKYAIENNTSVPCRSVMISGCRDDQLSQEDGGPSPAGLMTNAFLHTLQAHNYDVTCFMLVRGMQEFIAQRGNPQRPQLSTSRPLTETCIFVSNTTNGEALFIHT